LKVACKIGGNKLKSQSKNVEQQIYFSFNHRALGNVYEAGSFLIQQFTFLVLSEKRSKEKKQTLHF
jgi:hypothetical protein